MNKILSDYQINSELLDLIKDSDRYVILISPYISLWKHLLEQLERSIQRGVEVLLVFRGDQIEEYDNNGQLDLLEKIGVNFYCIDNLHTKLYLSEKKGILTSMNLYDSSTQKNKEIGLITEDGELLSQLSNYVCDLDNVLIDVDKDLKGRLSDWVNNFIDMKRNIMGEGYCIKCKINIPINVKTPYCKECFKIWCKTKNRKLKEEYCHI